MGENLKKNLDSPRLSLSGKLGETPVTSSADRVPVRPGGTVL